MFKRTKGYLLLTMLVLTGFAGRIHSDTLSGKERRILIKELKNSKANLMSSVEGLTSKQFNFKSAKNKLSVKECIYQLAAIENELWNKASFSLKQEPTNGKKVWDDESLASVIQNKKFLQSKIIKFKTVKEALKLYKKNRNDMQKFVNTSTENARMHIAQTSFGNFDVYQLLLLNTIIAKQYIDQIKEIKSNPDFPK